MRPHRRFDRGNVQPGFWEKESQKVVVKKIAIYAFLTMVCVSCVYPFLFMFSTSLKATMNIFSSPLELIPARPTLENYAYLFRTLPILRWVSNSFIVATAVTIAKIVIDSMAGYTFARRSFFLKNLLFVLILGTLMIPTAVTMIPSFLIIKNLRLLNTYWGLIIPPLSFPLGVFLLRQYMSTIPHELEDAARIDGCTAFSIYARLFFPLSAPAITVLTIFTFMQQWTSLLWPVIVTSSTEMNTLTVGVARLKAESSGVNWGLIMSANTVSLVPIVIIFLFLQRYFIEGMTAGSLKG